jgi:predicted ATPase/DNA-binding SARP family transcriptional activator
MADDSPPLLTLQLFGPFEARVQGDSLPHLRFRKGQALLTLLALRAGHEVERDWLAGQLWPDRTETPTLTSLRNSLLNLRQALGPAACRLQAPTARTLRLQVTATEVDVLAFDAAVDRGDSSSLEQAVALYRGPLLEGCAEEWAFQERRSRELAYLEALETLATQALTHGNPAGAESYLRRAVAADPLRETAQRALMQTLATRGNYAAVLQVYRDLRRRLHRDVNAEPDPETQALFQQLRAEARRRAALPAGMARSGPLKLDPKARADGLSSLGTDRSTAASPFPTLDLRPDNLPVQRTPLLGREQELAAVRALVLRAEVGLATLIGAGGTGKTRLGLAAAADLLDQFDAGVFFVGLAPISDPALVAAAVAQTLGVRETAGRTLLESLREYLRPRQMLLLLDNFEHVLPAAPLVAELLASCPRLKVLVTSRAPLHLQEEQQFPVPPLAIPDPQHLPPLEGFAQFAAVALFLQQAQAVKPGFVLTDENAPSVAEICCRLDGLPLAIELAATRIRLFSPQALRARLERRLPLLTGGARDLPARQRTLRNTIAWSYDLLAADEQKLFRRLSVFAGGFTLEAAAVVCGSCGSALDSSLDGNVLDRVASLADQSLLKQEEQEDGEPRFVMLETIREYARERLEESGEAGAIRRQHAQYFLTLAEAAEPELRGPRQREWLHRLEQEHDNLRAAREGRQGEQDGAEMALRLVGALVQFWVGRGHLGEGRQWLEAALSSGCPVRLPTKVRALNAGSWVAYHLGDYEAVRRLSEEALILGHALEDRRSMAHSLFSLALAASVAGDYERVRTLAEEGLAQALDVGDRWLAAHQLMHLGLVAWVRDDAAQASHLWGESLAVMREVGDPFLIAVMLANLGNLENDQGRYDRAGTCLREGLKLFQELRERRGIASCLEGLATMLCGQGQAARAARLLGTAEALREAVHCPVEPVDRRLYYDRTVAETRAAQGEAAFAAAWAEGRAASLEEAIACALQESSAP